jgi:hypothetical protein
MSQTAYSQSFVAGYPGMKADSRIDVVESLQAAVAIPLARAVVKMYGKQEQCRLPVDLQAVILDDAGTFTAGSIVTTVNGTVITTAWATNKDTTMAAHAAAILAGVADALSCAYSSGSHTITLVMKNTHLATVVTSVAGITGTMTISSTTITSTDVAANVRGIALNPGNLVQASDGTVQYAVNDAVSVLAQGTVYVLPEEVVTTDDPVYVRMVANSTKLPGMFGKSADSGKCLLLPGAKWLRGGTTSLCAVLSINLPQ